MKVLEAIQASNVDIAMLVITGYTSHSIQFVERTPDNDYRVIWDANNVSQKVNHRVNEEELDTVIQERLQHAIMPRGYINGWQPVQSIPW